MSYKRPPEKAPSLNGKPCIWDAEKGAYMLDDIDCRMPQKQAIEQLHSTLKKQDKHLELIKKLLQVFECPISLEHIQPKHAVIGPDRNLYSKKAAERVTGNGSWMSPLTRQVFPCQQNECLKEVPQPMRDMYDRLAEEYPALVKETFAEDSDFEIMALTKPPFNIKESELFTKRQLPLKGRNIDDAALVLFAKAVSKGALSKLESLTVHSNSIGDVGITALATAVGSGALASLVALILRSNAIGDDGMSALASACASGALASLKILLLNNNSIGDVGMQALASAVSKGALASLEELHLSFNKIGDNGMKALADACASGALAQCTFIDLSLNFQIGDAGLSAFAGALSSGALPKLNSLFISSPSAELTELCSSKSIELNID